MTRTTKGKRQAGYEYWSRRRGNRQGGVPGRDTKDETHSRERAEEHEIVRKEQLEASE